MSVINKSLAVLFAVTLLWGCTGKQPEPTTDDTFAADPTTGDQFETGDAFGGPGSGVEETPPGAQTIGLGQQDAISGDPLNDPGNILSTRTVYFDFDQSDITFETRPVLEAHARYLVDNANLSITLQGHADERGTREYNLSLGERRARAVQQMMILLGVLPSQLEVVSYGEERPAAFGHDEESWSLNRRVELIYHGR